MTPAPTYLELRELALDTPPIGDPPAGDDERSGVFGFVNEYQLHSKIYTISSFVTGDASVYLSQGGGYLGGVGVPNVASIGRETLPELEKIAQFMERTDSIELPKEGENIFYLLTHRGRLRRSARDITQDVKSIDFSLHAIGQAVITRMHDAKKPKTG